MHTDSIEAIRRFNRFYTHRIGALQESLLDSPFTLTESRLLWELAHQETLTVTGLSRLLGLDIGYLSRLLTRFKTQGLIESTRSTDDGRQQHLRLTEVGRQAYAPLDARSRAEVGSLLSPLSEPRQQRLLQAMSDIEELLRPPLASTTATPTTTPTRPVTLRPHRPGDLGWIVSRHGALYANEYQLDARFESLVARIAADFIDRFDPATEACWIAERDGQPVGSVVLVRARDEATQEVREGLAQLRLLLVDPAARGLGVGKLLTAECERFARQAGYRKIMLWTQSELLAARGIYARAGYRLVGTESHQDFGREQVGEIWELEL